MWHYVNELQVHRKDGSIHSVVFEFDDLTANASEGDVLEYAKAAGWLKLSVAEKMLYLKGQMIPLEDVHSVRAVIVTKYLVES